MVVTRFCCTKYRGRSRNLDIVRLYVRAFSKWEITGVKGKRIHGEMSEWSKEPVSKCDGVYYGDVPAKH